MFSESEETEVTVNAQSDEQLLKSIISKGMINRLGASCLACPTTTITSSKNKTYTVESVAKLRWHKASASKSYEESFFIVDSNDLFVILGRTAFPHCHAREVSVVVLQQQTNGNLHKKEAVSIANYKLAKMNDRSKSRNVKESKISDSPKRKSKTRRWRKNEVVIPQAKQEPTVRLKKGAVRAVNEESQFNKRRFSCDFPKTLIFMNRLLAFSLQSLLELVFSFKL